MESYPNQSPPRRRWLQFSLRTILLAIVIVAIGLAILTSYQQRRVINQLQAEVKRLKNEVGELTIEEGQEHKLHAIRVPTIDPRAWKWRVHVPEGTAFFLVGATGKVPQLGNVDGANSSNFPMQPGENIVTVALLEKGERRWDWFIENRAGNGSGSSRHRVSPEAVKLIGNCRISAGGVGNTCTSVEPGKDMELLRYRLLGRTASGTEPFDEVGEGIVVQIREKSTP